MLAGFALQVTALHFGPLALVQPILAVELLFVFGYLALRTRRPGERLARVAGRDRHVRGHRRLPSRGRADGGPRACPGAWWWLAGLATAARRGRRRRRGRSRVRHAPGRLPRHRDRHRWGFVAAVIKELSSHLVGGPGAIFTTWSPYVLAVTGAAAMLLTSHAMAAGPLAASQPGFTIGDPVTAILLGAFLFGERLGTSPAALAAEVLGLIVLALGVWTLSRSDADHRPRGPAARRPGRAPRGARG